MIEGGFVTKAIFLNNISGQEIIDKQDQINSSENMKVIATTILPATVNTFYAWIYYKVKESSLVKDYLIEDKQKIIDKLLPKQDRKEVKIEI